MAQQLVYRCTKCGFTANGWSDGNPYIEFSNGTRRYYYHPGGVEELLHDLITGDSPEKHLNERRRGNAPDHLCLDYFSYLQGLTLGIGGSRRS